MRDKRPPKGFFIRNRVLACENSMFEVFFDHVEDNKAFNVPDYLVLAPRQKGPKFVSGVGILPMVDGKYALLKIYRHILKNYFWEIPRGFVEEGEENIETARRELLEETGLVCEKDNIFSLGFIAPDAGIISARMHLFVALECQWDSHFVRNEIGHRELKLFSPLKIERLTQRALIQDPSTLIAYYRYSLTKKTVRKIF